MKRLIALFGAFSIFGFAHVAAGNDSSSVDASRKSIYFPKEVDGETWIDLSRWNEPILFGNGKIESYKSRHRLSISGISCVEYVIRVDESLAGRLNGTVKHRNKCKRTGVVETHRLHPSREEFAKLNELIETAEMYRIYPEFWVNSDEDICLDGNQILFERRNRENYRISIANAQCTAPETLHQVARQFIAISGEKDAGGLLR